MDGWQIILLNTLCISEQPVLLLVDGHATHTNIETSKFCMHHGIAT